VTTNTIPLNDKAKACAKIKVLSIAGLLAKAIHNIHTESSVSVLFT
jgi:ribose-phosphate pyrophosphokinase